MPTSSRFFTRPLIPADQDFLWEMLYQAIYVPAGSPPPAREVIYQADLAKYVSDWGQSDDLGLVAIDSTIQQPVGAAWLRLLIGSNRGYGYLDDHTPELSIAILPAYRGQGIGSILLEKIILAARSRYPAISLSVSVGNPA